MEKPIYYAKASVDTMMRKFKAEDLPPKGRFHYHQGVFLSGVYKTYELCGDERYFQYVKDWVDSCIDGDGEIITFDRNQLDDMQPGILLFPLLDRTGDARYRKVLDKLAFLIQHFPRNPVGGLWHKASLDSTGRAVDQMWLDGLYMAGPLSAEYAKRFDKPELFDLCAQQALLMEEKTRDPKTGLWYHAWDSFKDIYWADPETGLSPEFWGRSIGWVPVAVLDELDFLPEDHPKREELERLVRDILQAVCKFQGEDGRWWQVVDKVGEEGNWPETSCGCLYVAAICKAVRKGILPEEYLTYARKGFEGTINNLEWNGDNLLVSGVCIGTGVGDYAHYCARPTSTNDLHGVGAFLIMCTEAAKSDL